MSCFTQSVHGNHQNYLNRIYSQAVVSWNVQVIKGFTAVDLGENGLDHAENELLSAYNPEMNSVISAFKAWQGSINSQAAYLFLVPRADGGLQGYMPFNRQFGFVVAPTGSDGNVDAAALARTVAHELGHGIFSLRHTFSEKNFVTLPQGKTDNLMDYPSTGSGLATATEATKLDKYQWDLIHDPEKIWFAWLEEEGEGELGGSWTLFDKKHTLLFNHVYDHNNEGNLKYHEKIFQALAKNPEEESIDLEYTENEEKEWISQWKLRTVSSNQILEKIIKKIQKAEKGKKIEKMNLKAKGIYIGKYKLDDVEYPVAIYSEKDIIDKITKVQVSEVSELDNEENRKHLRAEETFIKYLVIAFYEEGSNEPVLMMQIEKFDISKLQNTKVKWLGYIGILNKEQTILDTTCIIVNAKWIGQFSSEINGRACHWCGGLGKCCNGGTPCSKCQNDDSKECCNVKCADTSLVTNCDSCISGNICDTKYCRSNNCCYQASLAMIEKYNVTTDRHQSMDIATLISNTEWKLQSDLQANSSLFKKSLSYIDSTLKTGKPIVIGVHYSNDKNGTYNSNKATFHFMVIVGKIHKNGKVYYRFYDPGRTSETNGKAETNLLEIDITKEMIHGLYNNKIYTVTEVRKNL